MGQMQRMMAKVFFLLPCHSTCSEGLVSVDHAASSYGVAVIVSEGQALGPADVRGGFVQAHGEQGRLLAAAGFQVVDNLGEQFCGPAPDGAGGWSVGQGWC